MLLSKATPVLPIKMKQKNGYESSNFKCRWGLVQKYISSFLVATKEEMFLYDCAD
jgi:hypothetical protein